MNEITGYDKRNLFNQEIKPLLEKIESICKTSSIPFFFTAAIENSVQGTTYENYAISALPLGLFLSNDRLVEHVKVSAGFEATLPDHIPDIDLD